MVLEVKIRKLGNSIGIILPKDVLGRLNVKSGDTLFLTETTESGYRLTAGDPEFARKVKAAGQLSRSYRDALRELAR
mgnify:CR=1 FL=1